nr:nucleotide-binding alpha-beta plait domain-containing protein [Tanacetum cinerariifolium]
MDNVGGRKNGDEAKGTANSYAHAVKGTQSQKEVMDDIPSLVLDDSCLNQKVYSLCLLGKVKESISLTNLKVVIAKEGYANIEIKYMGGFWVMIEFQDEETKKRNTLSRIASRWGTLLNGDELEDGGFHRKRICICMNMKTVLFKSFKMVYHGKVCWVHTIEVPGWVPDFEDETEEEYDSDDGSHEDEVKGGDSGNLKDLKGDSDVEKFLSQNSRKNLINILWRKIQLDKAMHSLRIRLPPGFTPNEDVDASVDAPDILLEKTRENDDQEDGGSVEKQTHLRNEALNDAQESICSGHFKKSEVPRTCGSILQLIDDLVNVGQTMGYDMTGCINNMEEIIESQGVNEVHQ